MKMEHHLKPGMNVSNRDNISPRLKFEDTKDKTAVCEQQQIDDILRYI